MTRVAPAAAHRPTACSTVGSASSMCAPSTSARPVTRLGWTGGQPMAGGRRSGRSVEQRRGRARRARARAPPPPCRHCSWPSGTSTHLYSSTNSKSMSFDSALREPWSTITTPSTGPCPRCSCCCCSAAAPLPAAATEVPPVGRSGLDAIRRLQPLRALAAEPRNCRSAVPQAAAARERRAAGGVAASGWRHDAACAAACGMPLMLVAAGRGAPLVGEWARCEPREGARRVFGSVPELCKGQQNDCKFQAAPIARCAARSACLACPQQPFVAGPPNRAASLQAAVPPRTPSRSLSRSHRTRSPQVLSSPQLPAHSASRSPSSPGAPQPPAATSTRSGAPAPRSPLASRRK